MIRSRTLQALRTAVQFDIPPESLARVLTATPDLLSRPERVAEIERHVRALLVEEVAIPVHARSSTLPMLGNVAEAFVESMLVELGGNRCMTTSSTPPYLLAHEVSSGPSTGGLNLDLQEAW